MEQKRKVFPVYFDNKKPSYFPTLIDLSEKAQSFLNHIQEKNTKVRFVLEFDREKGMCAHIEADEAIIELAKDMELQMRFALMVDGFNIRHVSFDKIHGVETQDLVKLAETLEMHDGDRILDMMCGYGAVSECILEVADKKAINIQLSMCDLHKKQLDRISSHVRQRAHDISVGDARLPDYSDETFNAIVIKMGVHEVPQLDQPLIFQQAFRVLKPGGHFVIWDVMPDTAPQQDAFMEQMQKKNELAGFESLIVDRYFFRGEQVPWLYAQAGFVNVQDIFSAHFKEGTLARLDQELGGDREKLKKLNDYVRQCTPDEIKSAVQYEDDGDNISMVIPNRIFRGTKPGS